MFKSSGMLKYFNDPYKLILEVDQGISDFYRKLIPKYIKLNKQLYGAHISIVRKEIPSNINKWKKYQNRIIEFEYENIIYNDETYYWLNAYSSNLEYIRKELGLQTTSEITRSPDGKHKFHITIGNTKNV